MAIAVVREKLGWEPSSNLYDQSNVSYSFNLLCHGTLILFFLPRFRYLHTVLYNLHVHNCLLFFAEYRKSCRSILPDNSSVSLKCLWNERSVLMKAADFIVSFSYRRTYPEYLGLVCFTDSRNLYFL